MFWSRSSPCRLIREPVRRRSSSVVPSSFSSLVTASLSAGWEMCIASLARRSEPCSVTAARYSSCSIRTLCSCRGSGLAVWVGLSGRSGRGVDGKTCYREFVSATSIP